MMTVYCKPACCFNLSVCLHIYMYIMRGRNSLSQRTGVPGCSGPKKTIQYNGEIRPLGIK